MWVDLDLSRPKELLSSLKAKALTYFFGISKVEIILITLTDTLWCLDLLKNHGFYNKIRL